MCTTWLRIDKKFYLMDLVRGRFEYPRLKETAIRLAEKYKPNTILIEDASTGSPLAQELRQAGVYAVQLIRLSVTSKLGCMPSRKNSRRDLFSPRGRLPIFENWRPSCFLFLKQTRRSGRQHHAGISVTDFQI